MIKIVASLLILGLCANVCFATTVAIAGTSQGSSFSGLNTTSTRVYVATNSSDATNWDSTVASATAPTGIPYYGVVFGPGATNDTSYVYGLATTTTNSITSITTIVKRTINNTIVGWANDTTELSVVSESKISPSIVAAGYTYGVGPGYLGIISQGSDGTNNQVWYTLVSGTSASPVKVTSTADVTAPSVTAGGFCTTTTFSVGNIWYDIGSAAFFYTYSKKVITQVVGATASNGVGTCGGTAGQTTVNTIYLGGVYVNGTAFMTAPLALATATPANSPSSIISGGDNSLNATSIFVTYKDTSASTGGANSATGITYYQKITKSASATAGTFTSLVVDTITGTITTPGTTATTTVYTTTYNPVAVWSSNFTYGIAVSNQTFTQTTQQYGATGGTYTYSFTNYLNLTSTPSGTADSGISYSSATGAGKLYGWQLNTGYTLVASWSTSTSGTYAYTWGTFYGNGTVNMTSTTLGSVQGPVSFYEDVNGTQWIGWTDVETANTPSLTYAGYLAKLQGQLNVPSGAAVLSVLSAFALFLAAIFIF